MIEKQKELHMKTNHRKWIDLGYLIIFYADWYNWI